MTDTDDLVKRTGEPTLAEGFRGFAAFVTSFETSEEGMKGEDCKMVAAKFRLAADRIDSLTAQLAALRDEAKEVVRPFAEEAMWISENHLDGHVKDDDRLPMLCSDIRRAAAFLAKLEDMK